MMRPIATTLVAIALLPATARAEPQRIGAQVEALGGLAFCVDGPPECERDALPVPGRMQPSFGGGVAIGARPRPWIIVAAVYRAGLFDPDYGGVDGKLIDHVVQHTIAAAVRPVLPVWRMDFGLTLGVGYSHQSADFHESGRREFTQGATFITGLTIDGFITDHVFAGIGAEMLANLHGAVCRQTSVVSSCVAFMPRDAVTPNHQVLFGLRLGSTFG